MRLFRLVKTLLWAALAAATTFAFISRFSPLSVAALACTAQALGFWLVRHRGELRAAYRSKEATASRPAAYDKLMWGDKPKPRLKDIAPGIVLLAPLCFYFGYEVSQGATPTKFARLGYEVFGLPGAVGAWCLAGVILLATGVESMLGSRAR